MSACSCWKVLSTRTIRSRILELRIDLACQFVMLLMMRGKIDHGYDCGQDDSHVDEIDLRRTLSVLLRLFVPRETCVVSQQSVQRNEQARAR